MAGPSAMTAADVDAAGGLTKDQAASGVGVSASTLAPSSAAAAQMQSYLGHRAPIVTIGDSLPNGGYAGNSFVTRGLRNAGSRYMRAENFAVGGKRTDEIIAEQIGPAIATGRLIAAFDGSTNDIAQAVGGTSSSGDLVARSNIKIIAAALKAANMRPVSLGNFPSSNGYVADLARHEIWRQIWAMKNGIPHVHVFSKLANADGTGAYATGYNVDALHPNSVGADIAGAELVKILDAPGTIAQIGALVNSAVSADILFNAVSFGGVGAALPTGYTASGAGPTFSVEAPNDGTYGNWLKASYTSAVANIGFHGRSVSLATLGWAPGDYLAVAFRVKTVATSETSLKGRFAFTGSATINTRPGWTGYFDEFSGAAGNDMVVYYEAQISPSALTTDTIRPTLSATTTGVSGQSIAIQRPLIYNLTQNGLA